MPSLIIYKKHIDTLRTVSLLAPFDAADPMRQPLQELCTLADGRTVACLMDGYTLPTQPSEIAASVTPLTAPVDPALLAEIKAASPHVRLINTWVQERIARRYSTSDEIKLLRLGASPELDAYNAYVEDCRAWGRAEKAKLGL